MQRAGSQTTKRFIRASPRRPPGSAGKARRRSPRPRERDGVPSAAPAPGEPASALPPQREDPAAEPTPTPATRRSQPVTAFRARCDHHRARVGRAFGIHGILRGEPPSPDVPSAPRSVRADGARPMRWSAMASTWQALYLSSGVPDSPSTACMRELVALADPPLVGHVHRALVHALVHGGAREHLAAAASAPTRAPLLGCRAPRRRPGSCSRSRARRPARPAPCSCRSSSGTQ